MSRSVCIFEDSRYVNLLPLVYTRAVYELRCGIDLLLDKVIRQYPKSTIRLLCRDYLADTLRERIKYPVNEPKWSKDGALFINGRVLMRKAIPLSGKDEAGVKDNQLVYLRLKDCSSIDSSYFLADDVVEKLKKSKVNVVEAKDELVNYPWDLIHRNPEQIGYDFKSVVGKGALRGKVYDGVHMVNKADIFIGEGTKVKPGVVLDAEGGPIYIGKEATIQSNSVVEGPAVIGDGSRLNLGTKMREGTTLGEVSRIGGEIEESIIHGYSNKQHDGFLGHAYLGMWVNLGAGTSNSDLKNNYSTVKVWIGGKSIDSGSMFVGLTMGDHSKSGLNTMFNTGTVVGVCCNVFGAGFPPKFVPSFSWGGADSMVTYSLAKGLDVAKKVMARRKKDMSQVEEKLLKVVFEMTAEERKVAGISNGK